MGKLGCPKGCTKASNFPRRYEMINNLKIFVVSSSIETIDGSSEDENHYDHCYDVASVGLIDEP